MNMRKSFIMALLCIALLVVSAYAYYISTLTISTNWTVEMGGSLHLYDENMVEMSTPSIDFGAVPWHGSVTWGGYISFEGNNGECGLEIVFPVDDAYQFSTNYAYASLGSTPVGFSITLSDVNMQFSNPYSGAIVFKAIALP